MLGQWLGQCVGQWFGALQAVEPPVEPPVSVEQPTGGWGYRNERSAERQRRKRRELEEEADRLEALLIAQKLLPPNPIVEARHTVREYLHASEPSRRLERAVRFAEKAQSALAWQLAMKQAQKEQEDEEQALITLLTLVA